MLLSGIEVGKIAAALPGAYFEEESFALKAMCTKAKVMKLGVEHRTHNYNYVQFCRWLMKKTSVTILILLCGIEVGTTAAALHSV